MMRFPSAICLLVWACLVGSASAAEPAASVEPLPGTQPLSWTDDLASRMVDGADRFLLRKLEASIAERAKHWQRDFSSPEAYQKSIEPNRKRLAHILGVRDERLACDGPDIVATPGAADGGRTRTRLQDLRRALAGHSPHPRRRTALDSGRKTARRPRGGHP